jgi:hypothetical protein
MTTMLSLILAFMLSIGGSPAASVNVNPSGRPGNTGIQAPIDNNHTINRFFEDYREKTAYRPISKKILEIPLIKQPETQIRFRFSLYVKEELRLVGYMDSMNMYQAFGMNPVNFRDPMGKVVQAEVGKHDMFKTKKVKTGKWYLDYTVVGAFNELRNAAALGINLVSNLFGTTEDIAFDVGDYGLSKVGVIERGELRDDPHMRNFFNAVMLVNSEAMASGTRTIMTKLDDLTYSLYNLVKSKGGKILDIRGNTIISTGAELSGDDLSRVFGGDDIYNTLDDIPIMSTDEVKDALQSGKYTKSTDWAYSIHEHHWYPQWLGGKQSGASARIRGFEHIADMEPELFNHIKKQIPQITKKTLTSVKSLIRSGVVKQERITEVLFKYYKSRYPNLSDEAIIDALRIGIE